MGTHTPGPWIEFADAGATVAILPACRSGTICAFDNPVPTRADARLIAAAPDLLDALKTILLNYGAIAGSEQRSIQKAQAAIIKAQGYLDKPDTGTATKKVVEPDYFDGPMAVLAGKTAKG